MRNGATWVSDERKRPPARIGLIIATAVVAVLVIAMGVAWVSARRAMQVEVPGTDATVDLGKLQAAAKAIENSEAVTATDPDSLKAYLPADVGGFARTELKASSASAAGIEGSQAEARYTRGAASLKLKVTDIGQAGALAGLAGVVNVNSSKETATGYEKTGVIDGRMTQESYDRQAKSGEYSVLVGERFMVEASGSGVTMDELKAAAEAVGFSRLEAAAKKG